MAKRKRTPGTVTAFKFQPQTDYRADEYMMYLKEIETGILQAATIEETMTDGDVDRMLEALIKRLKDPDQMTQLLATHASETDQASLDYDDDEKEEMLLHLTFGSLSRAFKEHGPLEAKDVIGIAKVIRSSIRTWNIGMHRRGYLTYLEDFLGQMGISTKRLTEAEAKELGLTDEFPEDG